MPPGINDPSPEVDAAFADFPAEHQAAAFELRSIVFDVAAEVGAAPLGEVLRWGQPSYLSARPQDSTATRLGWTRDGQFLCLLFHCRSTVLTEFQAAFPDDFRYDGNRAILFRPGEDLQADKIRLCIAHALTYRIR